VPADSIFSVSEIARAERFSWWARLWSWSALALSMTLAGWWGLSESGRRRVQLVRGPWWWRVLLVAALVTGTIRLATLPLSVAARLHARDYGLTGQAWDSFAIDLLLGWLVGLVGLSVVLLVLVGTARRWPRGWPIVAAGAMAALVLLASFVYPVLVEPLFNRFTPLHDGALREGVIRVAEQEGVAVDEVLIADASQRTTTLNAYVSGFGSTRRVVLYDTLVDDLPVDQALIVVAHELAHAQHQDVLVGSVLGALGAGAAVGVLGLWLSGAPPRRRSLAEPASVAWVIALLTICSFAISPVQGLISRRIEARADVTALRVTGDRDGFEEMQRELALRSVADPTPPWLSQFWFGTHPTSLQRISLARRTLP
jgi:STE24 endopeptidase